MSYHTIIPPASKSYSHRYIFGAFLSGKDIHLENVLFCDDINATKEALSHLGLVITDTIYSGKNTIFTKTELEHTQYTLNAQGSATLSRFLSCILCAIPHRVTFLLTGNEQLCKRSHALTSYYANLLNTDISYIHEEYHLPYTLSPQGFTNTQIFSLSCEQFSSQYISGLLFALSLSQQDRYLYLTPSLIPSFPYICSTLFTLQQYGIDISCFYIHSQDNTQYTITPKTLATTYKEYPQNELCIHIKPSSYSVTHHSIPSDFSAISYLLCFGLLGTYPVSIPYCGIDAPQADIYFLTILSSMNASIEHRNSTLIAYPSLPYMNAIDIDLSSCPDLFPTVALLQAFASGRAILSNIQYIRTKESNRVSAMLTGLYALGFDVQEGENHVYIGERRYSPTQTVHIATHHDHRIAMAFSLCNIIQSNMCSLDDYDCVCKSFPNYWDIFHSIYK